MELDDAWLMALVDRGVDKAALAGLCREAIAGGADMLAVHAKGVSVETARALVALCGEEDALLLFVDDVDLALVGADGVLFSDVAAPIATARAALGPRAILGMVAAGARDAQLAREVDADFLVYDVMASGNGAAAPRSAGTIPVYAGGLRRPEDARAAVGDGFFRLCVPLGMDGQTDKTKENMAAYARIIGRIL